MPRANRPAGTADLRGCLPTNSSATGGKTTTDNPHQILTRKAVTARATPATTAIASPARKTYGRKSSRDTAQDPEGDAGGPGQPTDPSIWSWISLFISTAYSIGSSFTSGSMNPLTIMVE